MLRKLVPAIALFVVATPALASDKTDIVAAVRKAIAYANAGDGEKFAGMMAPGGIVIDEFAPFRWEGGMPSWAASYTAYNTQNEVTAPHTTLLKFGRVLVDGDRAYVEVKVAYSYKEHGKPRKELGADVFVLTRTDAGWRVLSFAWVSKNGIDTGENADAALKAVRDEMNGFNDGSVDMSKIAWAGVIDEFPAYSFAGVADWGADFGKTGQTDLRLALGDPEHLSVNGNDAYIVLAATVRGMFGGKPFKEKGHFIFVVSKVDGVWKNRSWAWTME